MIKKATAVIRLKFPSKKEAEMIQRALKPETKFSPRHRSKVQLTQQGKEITLIFEAEDTTALRASLNSYLRWLHLLHNIYETLNTYNPKHVQKFESED